MKQHEDGFSEVLDETLIIGLGVLCAVVVMMLVFGVIPTIQKTAYIVPLSGTKDVAGKTVITVFDRGGEPVYFNATPLASYKAAIYVDTSAGSFAAVPAPGVNVLKPGDLVYLYYTGSGFIIASNLTGASITTLPAGQVTVRIVDSNSNVLISREVVVKGTGTVTPSPTITANVTTVTTTPIPTATATSTRTVTVIWSPNGLGYGSISPPAQLANSAEVKVPRGSSKTFYFVPNVNKAVQTITLEGTQVYSGSSVGATISYTVSNIAEDRTLMARFG
jgi:hypothetical protein